MGPTVGHGKQVEDNPHALLRRVVGVRAPVPQTRADKSVTIGFGQVLERNKNRVFHGQPNWMVKQLYNWIVTVWLQTIRLSDRLLQITIQFSVKGKWLNDYGFQFGYDIPQTTT